MEFVYILSGLVVGFIVGMTGVGGGSLMTPILLAFGIPPAKAVGTDLLYAAITKMGGIYVHQKQKNIDWRITGWLSAGSLPAALLTVLALYIWHPDVKLLDSIIKHALGFALMLTASAILFKKPIMDWVQANRSHWVLQPGPTLNLSTVITGVFLGVLVTLSSIGAGAVGTVALFLLYPLLPTSRLVGTEIAHAVPLTLIAGMGHAGLGNLNWELLLLLLAGSLPGIYIGSHLTGRIPDHILRPALALMLIVVGVKLVAV